MFCWCLALNFLQGTCFLHQQRYREKVVVFLLIRSFLIIELLRLLLVAQQVPPHLLTHCRPLFPNHRCLCCSALGSVSRGIRLSLVSMGFPGIEKVVLCMGQAMLLSATGNCLLGMCVSSSLYTLLIIMAMVVLRGFCVIEIIIKGNWRQQVSTKPQATDTKT